jgi:hypothetical protein
MQFVKGTAILNGKPVTWQTAGIYRVDVAHGWIRRSGWCP